MGAVMTGSMIRLALFAALLAACGDGSPPGESDGHAPVDSAPDEQTLEIDYDTERVLFDDESRGILSESSIDHERGILYVRDYEEPEGILAFSLDTGERLRTFRTPTGDGPRELPEGIFQMSAASNGRLYVSDMTRVIEFGPLGEYVSTWSPNVPPSRGAVCDFDGQPAVPTLDGAVRRGDSGVEEGIGPNVVVGNDLGERTEDELRAAAKVALHPLRRVSGEPCPGMLPSVDSSPATAPLPASS